ncbi:MAG TPA: ASCH domain-containing protein [Kofleriaceae bacterium]|nr:ASCH domain-containing protein [Kofleriaceae bacterium]
MLLFKKPFHAGLVDGSIRVTFRSWDKPHVRPGGRYRCHPIGVLEVDSVTKVRLADITAEDATLAGFATRDELMAFVRSGPKGDSLTDDSELFRIELHHGGDGDRVETALDDQLTDEDVAALATKLARLDSKQPWTRKTMQLIAKHPRIAASKLAPKLGRETLPFKIDVRKLKKLGLTQSFEVGYELSPRGRAFLERSPKAAAARRTAPSPRRPQRSAAAATRRRATSRT